VVDELGGQLDAGVRGRAHERSFEQGQGERHQERQLAVRIHEVDRVAVGVGVEVRVAAGEAGRVLGGPAGERGVVIASAEAHEARIYVVQAAGEAEGLELRVGIGEDAAMDVVVEALRNRAGLDIDDEAGAAEASYFTKNQTWAG
jgi:hypothetical protein